MEDTQSSSVSTSAPVIAKDESGTQKMGFFDAALTPPQKLTEVCFAAKTYGTRELFIIKIEAFEGSTIDMVVNRCTERRMYLEILNDMQGLQRNIEDHPVRKIFIRHCYLPITNIILSFRSIYSALDIYAIPRLTWASGCMPLRTICFERGNETCWRCTTRGLSVRYTAWALFQHCWIFRRRSLRMISWVSWARVLWLLLGKLNLMVKKQMWDSIG